MVIFLVIKNLIWHDPVAGWASMMCVMIFLGGIQMLCLGVLGQYMSRMYTEMKQRPLYIIRETSEDNENDEDEV